MELVKRHPLEELFRASGHTTYSAMGVLWIDAGRLSIISVAHTEPVDATKEEVDALLRKSKKLTAIFTTPLATGIKSGSFWVRNRDYGTHRLQRQFRQHVRRAAKDCDVRLLDWDTLRRKGIGCNIDTFQRRGAISNPLSSQAGWSRFCDVAASVPGLEAWGCFHREELLAYLIAYSKMEVCEAMMMHRSESASPFCAAHLLFHNFTQATMRRPEISAVTMGREWFPPRSSLSQFKKHAGYHTEEIQLAVVLHPEVRLILGNVFTRRVLRFLRAVTLNYTARFDSLEALDAASATRLPRRLELAGHTLR
jgi:hypothetical protein